MTRCLSLPHKVALSAAISAPQEHSFSPDSPLLFSLSVSICCVSLFFITIKFLMTHFNFVQLSYYFVFIPFLFSQMQRHAELKAPLFCDQILIISGIHLEECLFKSHSDPSTKTVTLHPQMVLHIFFTNFFQILYIFF